MPYKIVVTNPINEDTLKQLEEVGEVVMNDRFQPWSRQELQMNCQGADALMVFMTDSIDEAFLDECPNLKVIAGALKGYNNIDSAACSDRNIALTIVPDLLTEPTAELTIGLMISVARNLIPGNDYIREGAFKGWRPMFYGNSINNSTVGIIGAGAVGKTIMRMLMGFNCQILYTDKKRLSTEEEKMYNAALKPMEEIQKNSDFLVLAIHLTDSTKYMVDKDFLERMKEGSYLINPARGSLVNEAAVAEALSSGHLAGYASDTFEMEDWTIANRPKEIHADLLSSNKTVLTPHIGSAVTSVRQAIEQSAAESLITVLNGQIPDTTVNAEKLSI